MTIATCDELIEVVGTTKACSLTGRSKATHYRAMAGPVYGPPAPRPTPSNALSEEERAVKMVQTLRKEDPGDHGVIGRVARQLGVGVESLRTWVKQAEVDAGSRAGVTTEEHQELVKLRKENFELRRANDILQSAATFFGAELDRRHKK